MKISSCDAISAVSDTKSASRADSWPVTIQRWSGKAIGRVVQWHGRVVQRRQLCELNDRLLTDIGVTRIDACRESSKPFWQA